MYQLLFLVAGTTGRQGRGHGVIDRLLDREKRDIRLIRTTEHIHQIMIQRVMYMTKDCLTTIAQGDNHVKIVMVNVTSHLTIAFLTN